MAKTVFGVPGANKQGEAGEAVAPGGAPGAQQGGKLPQKGGPAATVAQRPMKSPAAQPQAAQPKPQPAKPQPAKPQPAKPAPMAAPMAKPAAQGPKPSAPAQGGGAANRTMFGMPAVKPVVPGQAAPAPAPQAAPAPAPQAAPAPAPQAAPAPAPQAAPAPAQAAPAQAAPEDDAFLKTQVGGSAVAATAKTAEQPAFEMPDTVAAPDPAPVSTADTGPIPATAGAEAGGGFGSSGGGGIQNVGGHNSGGYDDESGGGSSDDPTLYIAHQDEYSRGQLLLRSFFGIWYIALPHVFMINIFSIWSSIINFISFWAILFTGRFPQGMFEYQVGMMNWGMRLTANMYNLVDTYPAFWTASRAEDVYLEVPYPEELSRGKLLLRAFFGFFYIIIPHGICLYGRMIATAFLNFIAWWVVLFTGSYPEGWHAFNVGTLRWMVRLNLHLLNMTDQYPPFSGKE